ncbi:FtsX-like permease family protein [Glutamicibacter sp. NPDC087344]|uniref:ABC transporter permease n=1 Tax=Glutamicibacter sp. NPDC087344 TaxID=3363994 RepID=UPI00382782DF
MRLAWRDIVRNSRRSVLIVALIALPIAVMTAALVVGMSRIPTAEQTITRELGTTQGRISTDYLGNGAVRQGPWGALGLVEFEDTGAQPSATAAFEDLLPSDYQILPLSHVASVIPQTNSDLYVATTIGDVLNPAFDGKYELLDGRSAQAQNEVLASTGLLKAFDLRLGDDLDTAAGTFTLVGTLRNKTVDDYWPQIYFAPDQLPAVFTQSADAEEYYLVGSQEPTWALVEQLNERGLVLTSGSFALSSEESHTQWLTPVFTQFDASSGVLIGFLALTEVGLLAGAAFAVGTRKQQRELALLAVIGTETSTLQKIVTASGLWLGLFAGTFAALIGIGAGLSFVGYRLLQGSASYVGLRIPWWWIIAMIALAVIAGVCAAFLPARAVARQASLAKVRSTATQKESQKPLRIGLALLPIVLLLFGSALAVNAWSRKYSVTTEAQDIIGLLTVLGTVALLASLLLLSGTFIRFFAANSTRWPLVPRLAARDSARHLGRSIPAVAAVLAATTLSGALLVLTASTERMNHENYTWEYNHNQGVIPLEQREYVPASEQTPLGLSTSPIGELRYFEGSQVLPVVQEVLGTNDTAQVLQGTPSSHRCWSLEQQAEERHDSAALESCVAWALAEPSGHECYLADDNWPLEPSDFKCEGSMATGNEEELPALVVGGESELAALLGRAPSAEALQMLQQGGAVLSNPVFQNPNSSATVVSYEPIAQPTFSTQPSLRIKIEPIASHEIPAVVEAPDKPLDYYAVISPETAQALAVTTVDRAVLVTVAEQLSQAQDDLLQGKLRPILGEYSGYTFELGPPSASSFLLWMMVAGSAVITLSAAGITAGLALADGRNDQSILASLGASPRLRRAISAMQLLLTTVLGTSFGLLAGSLITVVTLLLERDAMIEIPWAQFTVLIFAVPLCGSAAAWLLTQNNLPIVRRRALS